MSGSINYEDLVNESMYMVVAKALKFAEKNGLSGENHFYITFRTKHKGVVIPVALKKTYKTEMAILLQHDFKDLKVSPNSFSVDLSFNGKREKLVIPFSSIVSFADPSEMFELEFKRPEEDIELFAESIPDTEEIHEDNVIDIEKFRRNKEGC